MRTTLILDDTVALRLKEEAARQGLTMSALVESALRSYFERARKAPDLPPLPTFRGGHLLVDVSNREALYQAMGDDLCS